MRKTRMKLAAAMAMAALSAGDVRPMGWGLSTRDATGRQDDMASKIAGRLAEIGKSGGLKREATFGAVDVEARTVELSFSSEIEYPRWFGIEVLDHSDGAVDLGRLNNKAAVLWNHNWDDQRGVVESASIVERKGRALLRFSRSPAGDQLLNDIADGIVTKVSVGYQVHGMRWIEDRDGVDVFLVTAWTPYEISMVSVPADDTVGVGRSAKNPQEETPPKAADNPAINPTPTIQRTDQMHIKIVRNAAGDLVRAEVDEAGNIVKVLETLEKAGDGVQAARNAGADAERARVRSITDMGKLYDATDLAMEFIGSGKTADEFQRALLDKVVKERNSKPMADQERNANIGMGERDLNRYSLMNVIRALANPTDANAQKAAAFEIECSQAAARQYGKEAKGIIIPQDVLGRQFGRAFNAGTNGQATGQTGANLVATDLAAGSFIEMLRNRTTIMRLGTVLGGLVGNLDVSKQTGGATGYWLGEGEDATEGAPVIGQIGLSPKTVAAYTDITRRLMMQSTPDAEGIVRRDLLNALGLTIDLAGYYGSGAGDEPRGIKNYSGLNAVDFATAEKPTFAELVQMETEVASDNADVNSMGYVGNARFRGHCKTAPKFGAGTESTIWEGGNTVNGYRAEITNQIANGDVFFGNFADLIIGLWGGLDMTVDPYSLSKSGGIRIVVFQDVDFVLRRVESLCYGSATVVP